MTQFSEKTIISIVGLTNVGKSTLFNVITGQKNKAIVDSKAGTTADNVIVSTGAKFALFEAITALCGVGDEVIVFAPFWLSYPEMVKASGAKTVIVQTKAENDFAPTPEDLEKAITEKTKLIIVNSLVVIV